MPTCAECGNAVPDAVGDAWCGGCGALLEDALQVEELPAVDPAGPDFTTRRRWTAVAAVVVLGMIAVAANRVDPDAAPTADTTVDGEGPIGRTAPSDGSAGVTAATDLGFSAEGTVLWERDLAPSGPDDGVRAAGDGHVLVGDRLVATDPPTQESSLRALPDPVRSSAIDSDGSWAVAEFGRVVFGSTQATPATVVALAGDWTPSGAAVAWVDGEPVFVGGDGLLGRVARDGSVAWRTASPVERAGPVGTRWVAGRDAQGDPVAVALSDGTVVALDGAPLAFLDDVVVLAADDVQGVDLRSGETLWSRADEGYAWRGLEDALVAEGAGEIVRVDPRRGRETGRVTGFVPAATGPGVVSQQQGQLVATAWGGLELWRRQLDPAATHSVVAVDADRVAVVSTSGGSSRVTVLGALDGSELTVATAPTRSVRTVVGGGDVVEVLADQESVLRLAISTGSDTEDAASAPEPGLAFASGAGTVRIEVGVATVRGVRDGAVLWTTALTAPLATPPARSGTNLLVALVDGSATLLDPVDGRARWELDLGALPTAVGSDGQVLLVGTADGLVLLMDPDGQPVTRTPVGTGAVAGLVAGPTAAALLDDRLVGVEVAG